MNSSFGRAGVLPRIATLAIAWLCAACGTYTAQVPPGQLPALIPALQRVERGETVNVSLDGTTATIQPSNKPELRIVLAIRPLDAPGGPCPAREILMGSEVAARCEPFFTTQAANMHAGGAELQMKLSPTRMLLIPIDEISEAELRLEDWKAPSPPPKDRRAKRASPDEIALQSIPIPDTGTTLAISPYHLFWPFVKLTAEFKAHQLLSFALTSGAGRYRGATAAQFGGQVRVYPSRSFARGFHVGLQSYAILMALSNQASGEGPNDFQMDEMREAIAYSPFAGDLEWARLRGQSFYQVAVLFGYKYTWPNGITAVGQFAPGYGAYFGPRSRFASEAPGSAMFAPVFNVDLGYSF
jgi:hypothetical protein